MVKKRSSLILNKSVDGAEVGEMLHYAKKRIVHVINKIVEANHKKGITGKYYIHFWFQPIGGNYSPNYHCRRTRPSPYEKFDHYLWSVDDGGIVKYEWCIPKKEILTEILSHPHDYDPEYVAMLKNFTNDKMERIEDYMIEGKVT